MVILIENWWTLAIRGIVALLFGAVAFFFPAVALTYLVLLFGCYALFDGIFVLAAAIRSGRQAKRTWTLVFLGVVGIAAGIQTFLFPAVTALALLGFIAAWAIVTGVIEVAAAVQLRREITGEWMLALDGVISTVLGFVLIFAPMIGALALVWWLGAYATASGVILTTLAFRLRKVEKTTSLGTP